MNISNLTTMDKCAPYINYYSSEMFKGSEKHINLLPIELLLTDIIFYRWLCIRPAFKPGPPFKRIRTNNMLLS